MTLENNKNTDTSETNFYVPIDYSDVRDAIPVGEDIIYSTLFAVHSHGGEGIGFIKTQHYISHALFTKQGIAFQEPRGKTLTPHYLPWYKVWMVVGNSILIKKGTTIYTYILNHHPDYESPQNFEMRQMKFYLEFAPLVIDEKKKNKYTKGLKRFEKGYNKIVSTLGEDKIEFIKTNKDYEEFLKLKQESLKTLPKWQQFLARKIG